MWEVKNQKLKAEVDKINWIVQTTELNKSFLIGYLSFATTSINPDVAILNYSKLGDKLAMVIGLMDDKAIHMENIIELIAYIKIKSQQNKKEQLNYIVALIDQIINDLVLDNDYIKKIYLRPKQSQQHNKAREQALKSEFRNGNIGLGMECPICIVEIPHSDISLLFCGHNFHKSCFRQFIELKVTNKDFPILCPIEECGNTVSTKDIEEDIEGDLLQKYYDFTFHTYIEKNVGNTSWCPTPGCTSVFSFDNRLEEYRCPACKKNYCLKCRCEMHHGVTCVEYREANNLSQDDKAFVEFAKGAHFKQCPKCRFWVQKNHGCHHMTCRCKFQFCYKCGMQYGTCHCQQSDYSGSSDNEVDDDNDHDDHDDDSEPLSAPQIQIRGHELSQSDEDSSKDVSDIYQSAFDHSAANHRMEQQR